MPTPEPTYKQCVGSPANPDSDTACFCECAGTAPSCTRVYVPSVSSFSDDRRRRRRRRVDWSRRRGPTQYIPFKQAGYYCHGDNSASMNGMDKLTTFFSDSRRRWIDNSRRRTKDNRRRGKFNPQWSGNK